jgi:1,4-dihydroxy-2-naphthoate octaprenyltransferase
VQAVLAFLRLGRLQFLAGGFLLYGLGAVIAAVHGAVIDPATYALGQGVVTAFQLMTHYANDFYDYEADRANQTPTRWSGGSRVLIAGELPRSIGLVTARVLALLGAGLSALVIARCGTTHAPALGAMFVLAWAYSAPPLRLCARGLGELATALVVTGLVPWLGFSLQAPGLVGAATVLLAITPLALLQLAMLLAIELPDAAGDAATGKRTLVVQLGASRSARLYALVLLLAYLWLPLALLLGLPPRVALAAALPFPVALWRIARLSEHADPRAFERLAFFGVFQLVATTVAELAAFVTLL